jgi:hypothetical protein
MAIDVKPLIQMPGPGARIDIAVDRSAPATAISCTLDLDNFPWPSDMSPQQVLSHAGQHAHVILAKLLVGSPNIGNVSIDTLSHATATVAAVVAPYDRVVANFVWTYLGWAAGKTRKQLDTDLHADLLQQAMTRTYKELLNAYP